MHVVRTNDISLLSEVHVYRGAYNIFVYYYLLVYKRINCSNVPVTDNLQVYRNTLREFRKSKINLILKFMSIYN